MAAEQPSGGRWERNAPIVSAAEQDALAATRVLIAGCGSVGGAAVEPLVRLGIGSLALADPDVYELHNINRQACVTADLGRSKVSVLARRARAINPGMEVTTLPRGLALADIEAALAGVTLVVDGIDSSGPALPVKLRLHELAAERRLPTISAADLAGQATLYVFDYRRDPRPLRGRAPLRAFREGREMEAAGMTGPRPIPTDFLALVRRRLASGAPWPQVAYTAAATGALTAAVVLELLRGERVPPLVRVDLHRAVRPPARRLADSARRPLELLRTAVAAGRGREEPEVRPLAAPAWALPALQALQAAPSTHNEQPWALSPAGERLLRLVPRPDLQRRGEEERAAISLGCALGAIEAMVPATATVDGLAAEIAVEGDADPAAAALLGARQTNRLPHSRETVPPRLLARLVSAAEANGAFAGVVDGARLGHCAAAVEFAKREELGDAVAMEELLTWYRRSPRDRRFDSDGLLPATLGSGQGERLAWGVAARGGRSFAAALGRALLVRRTGSLVRSSAAVLLLAAGEPVALGRALIALWLEATGRGLAVHPIGVSGGRTGASALADLLGEQREPVSLAVRIGYAPAACRSPRLPLERLLVPAEVAP
jgi:hypothetical protein